MALGSFTFEIYQKIGGLCQRGVKLWDIHHLVPWELGFNLCEENLHVFGSEV